MKHENWRARALRLIVTPLAPAKAWPTYACTKRSPVNCTRVAALILKLMGAGSATRRQMVWMGCAPSPPSGMPMKARLSPGVASSETTPSGWWSRRRTAKQKGSGANSGR